MYPKLDISDRTSVNSLRDEVSQYGSVDVLINNAGVNLDAKYNATNARKNLEVNYRATMDVSGDFPEHSFSSSNPPTRVNSSLTAL